MNNDEIAGYHWTSTALIVSRCYLLMALPKAMIAIARKP